MLRRRGSYQRGFTLVEVVIVTLIMGILATVAAPRFIHRFQKYRVEGAARHAATDLRYAIERAQSKSQSVTVQFSVSTDKYNVVGAPHPSHPLSAHEVDVKQMHGVDLTWANFGGQPSVSFNGFGVPTAAGTIMFQCGSVQASVGVDPAGRVVAP